MLFNLIRRIVFTHSRLYITLCTLRSVQYLESVVYVDSMLPIQNPITILECVFHKVWIRVNTRSVEAVSGYHITIFLLNNIRCILMLEDSLTCRVQPTVGVFVSGRICNASLYAERALCQ